MVEKIVLDYLRGVLDVPVDVEVPEKEPDEYVIIEKTGSSEENFVFSATFALKSHAKSLYAAAELNEKVKAAMDGIIALDDISSSKLNSDYNFTDTAKKRYRYQAIYDLYY